jgi:hypothetical protein
MALVAVAAMLLASPASAAISAASAAPRALQELHESEPDAPARTREDRRERPTSGTPVTNFKRSTKLYSSRCRTTADSTATRTVIYAFMEAVGMGDHTSTAAGHGEHGSISTRAAVVNVAYQVTGRGRSTSS